MDPLADRCPLCQGDNHCAVASNEAASTCWCMTAEISPTALQAIPDHLRGVRCLCERCASHESKIIER